MKQILVLLAVGLAVSFPGDCRADFAADMQAASHALEPVMGQAAALLADGRFDDANQKILSVFPEASRTPAQELALGNVLAKVDPKLSYALHKQAAAALPNEPDVHLEWAMDQHRAGEYAAAIPCYEIYIKANPMFAPTYGLLAECLILIGKSQEAADTWAKSENAPQGTLETFESWDNDVHDHSTAQKDRCDWIAKVRAGDEHAAEQLIKLDADFPWDWWNKGPDSGYLRADLALVRATKFQNPAGLDEVLVAGDAAFAASPGGDPGKVSSILHDGGYLLDDKSTLPQRTPMLNTMLGAAESANLLTPAVECQRWGDALLKRARDSKDAEAYNIAAHVYLHTPQGSAIDQEGWDATGDERFAASLLAGLMAQNQLKLDDARLTKAAAQFPDNSLIAGDVLTLTRAAGQPIQPALVAAIKAEYAHFSPDPISMRPSAHMLEIYFGELTSALQKP